jgi:hypothetical protein
MPAPRNRPVPRFAPEGIISLITALDIFGRAVDLAWTGEEVEADTAPEPCGTAFRPQRLAGHGRSSRVRGWINHHL